MQEANNTSVVADTEPQSSFGIRKIVDCKLDKSGKQLYKVKWEPTWEPAENLASCQHLIDEFWKFVSNAKSYESFISQQRKRTHSNSFDVTDANNQQAASRTSSSINSNNNFKEHRLLEDSKSEVQMLIARANATSVGQMPSSNSIMNTSHNMTPTSYLNQSPIQKNMVANKKGQIIQNQVPFNTAGMPITNSPTQRSINNVGYGANSATPPKVMKTDMDDSKKETPSKQSTSAISTSSLKYLENFDNPYVKVIVACKICGKEQPFKQPSSWKQHYYTHSDKKPHACTLCSKSFIRPVLLRQHMEKYHSGQSQVRHIKTETVKIEDF